MSKRGLGRGFDSLIPTEVTADMPASVQPVVAGGEGIHQVAPAKIAPNPHQPRTEFNAEELQGLADSIKTHGVVHPPVVSDRGDGTYELIAGERRVRAAKLAGLATIPVIVRSYDEQQKLELAVLENVQRAQLNPVETAVAYRKLADEFNLTLEQIGARMGKARSTVANSMRLLELPKEALAAVADGRISEAHGRAILAVKTPQRQAELLQHILSERWSVRQAEEFARDAKEQAQASSGSAPKAPNAPSGSNHLTRELEELLGTKVSLQRTAKGGKLLIEYYSDEELQRIIDTIRGE